MRYNPDEMIEFWLHEYEDVLKEVFGDGETSDHSLWNGFGGMTKHPHDDDAEIHSPRPGGYRDLAMDGAPGAAERDDPAWTHLDEIMQTRNGSADDGGVISDSESIVTVGELGEEAQMLGKSEEIEIGEFARQQADPIDPDPDGEGEGAAAGKNTWEHMSPTTLSRLPPSPNERRRSSAKPLSPLLGQVRGVGAVAGQRRKSSARSPLRPVIPAEKGSPRRPSAMGSIGAMGLGVTSPGSRSPVVPDSNVVGGVSGRRTSRGEDENPFVDDDDDDGDDDEDEMRGPMPIERETTDQRERMGAVDEVEYAYGE